MTNSKIYKYGNPEFEMESRYIPNEYAGKSVGIEGKITGLVGLVTLGFCSPVFFAAKGINRITKGKSFSGIDSIDFYIDTLKMCYEVAVRGRLPTKSK